MKQEKICPKCNNDVWSLLRSLNVKKCTKCAYEIDWHLKPGQKSLISNNRK